MIKNLLRIFKKNFQIIALTLLIIVTIISTSFFNYTKNVANQNYSSLINNIYLKKTLNHFFNNLDPII